jgi:eukaryotic-like serine/threonine-protein kinase
MSEPRRASEPLRNERLDRYEVLGELAQGGMAEILLGRLVGPSGFERVVVIKRILPHLAREKAFVEMFLDEARTVARLRHPNVVQVYELGGEVPTDTDDAGPIGVAGRELYLVMEYLEGESVSGLLRRLAARKEVLDPWLAAHLLAEACRGLHAAHELTDGEYPLDLVHRDISPQNLFVTYAGSVKVLDFGIAKASDRTSRTEAGQVKGKLLYMSPEQCEGRALDRRSDVFALGAVLHELLTGRSLFRRATPLATLKAICEQAAPPPSAIAGVNPQVALFDQICARALARRRDERYATAAELRRDLLLAMRTMERERERPDDAEERLGHLMHDLFGQRIEEKREMLRKARSLSVVTHIPIAEADEATDAFAVSGDQDADAAGVGEERDKSGEQLAVPSVSVEIPASVPPHERGRASDDTASAPPRPRRGGRLIAGLAVVAGLGVAIGTAGLTRARGDAAVSASGTAASAAAPDASSLVGAEVAPDAAVAPAPLPVASTVTLQIESIPPGARVSLDGRDLGATPLATSVLRGDLPLALSLRHPGFLPLAASATPSSDQRLVLTLPPRSRSSPPATAGRPRANPRTPPAIEKLP